MPKTQETFETASENHRAGKLDVAEALYRQVIDDEPHHAEALHRIGLIAVTLHRYDEAVELITKAIAVSEPRASYHSDLGETFRRCGRLDLAVASFQQALALQKDLPFVYINLGGALHCSGRFDEAVKVLQISLRLWPDLEKAHHMLGNALSRKGEWADAVESLMRSVEINPNNADALSNLGNALWETGRFDEAIAACKRALIIDPQIPEANVTLSSALIRNGRFEQARNHCLHALAHHPQFAKAHWNLALILLTQGDYENGWREYEWRRLCPGFSSSHRNFSVPLWSGCEVRDQTILVHTEQGYGDTIQFLRYLAPVRQQAAAHRVLLECPSALTRLLDHSGGWNAELITPESKLSPLPPFDTHISLLSLPVALRAFTPVCPSGPYLRADPRLRITWRTRLMPSSHLRVGLTWAGSATHMNDRSRSVTFEQFAPILRVPRVDFYSLQMGSFDTPLAEEASHRLIDLTAQIGDFADTAALVAELDLVISVDTSVAHLAGAMSKSVWTLLPQIPDWRWGLEGAETPWYSKMRLFRQTNSGDWASVIERVSVALRDLVG
jgi:tetratricopeptide (TPR) repeat protein